MKRRRSWLGPQPLTHDEWKDVYIKQDLTKSQRALGKKHEEELKKEAERRNSLLKNGEDWTWGIGVAKMPLGWPIGMQM